MSQSVLLPVARVAFAGPTMLILDFFRRCVADEQVAGEVGHPSPVSPGYPGPFGMATARPIGSLVCCVRESLSRSVQLFVGIVAGGRFVSFLFLAPSDSGLLGPEQEGKASRSIPPSEAGEQINRRALCKWELGCLLSETW